MGWCGLGPDAAPVTARRGRLCWQPPLGKVESCPWERGAGGTCGASLSLHGDLSCHQGGSALCPKQQQSWSPWRSSCIQQANKAEHAGGGVASPRLLASSTLLARSGKNSGILSLDVVSGIYCGAEIAVGVLAEVLRNINYPNSLGLKLSWQSYEHICLVSSQPQ